MSLPTKATFYYRGDVVCSLHCNIGWHYDDDLVPETVKRSLKDARFKFVWDTVVLYEKTWTKEDLAKQTVIAEENKRKRLEELERKKAEPEKPINIAMIRNVIPNVNPSEIVDVQPMSEDAGQIFTLRYYNPWKWIYLINWVGLYRFIKLAINNKRRGKKKNEGQ